jgi:putative ABC transport system permease protein
MRTDLALQNLLSQPQKTALALAGIGVAIILIFLQLGFLGAVQNTATDIFDQMEFDLMVRSPNYLHLADPDKFDRRLLDEIAGLPEVQRVNDLQVGRGSLTNATGHPQGLLLFVVAWDDPPFRRGPVTRDIEHLAAADTVLLDRKCHPDFSPEDSQRFGPRDVGRQRWVSERNLRVAGLFTLGAGLASKGAAMVSQSTFRRLLPYFSQHDTTFGLVHLQPDSDHPAAARSISERFRNPDGSAIVEVLTRPEVNRRELQRWVGETPIGFIFFLGVVIAAVVGATIVYMILANDVAARLPEYATLRAMGYRPSYLAGVVIRQAAYLAIFAFGPALAIAWLLYLVTGLLAGIDLVMTVARILAVLVLTVAIGGLSGVLALKKLWQAQPADLF